MCCFVKECKNIRRLMTDSNVTFHRVPKNEERRKQWLSAIGREGLNNEAVRFICSQHFKIDDFLGNHKIRYLKSTAIPNVSLSKAPTVATATHEFSNGEGALEIDANNFKTITVHGNQEWSPQITSFDDERSDFKFDHIYSKKEPSVWTREMISLLITLYEQHPCLYKCDSPDYYKKDVGRFALIAIAEEINTRHQTKLTAEGIKKMIHVIRSQYLAEINAIAIKKNAEETYHPRLWCFDQLHFIAPVKSIKSTDREDIKIEMNLLQDNKSHDSQDDLEHSLNGDDFEIPGISLKDSDTLYRLKDNISLASNTSYNSPGKRKRSEVAENILHSDSSKQSQSIHFPFAQYLISELELIDNEEVLNDLKHDIVKLVFQAKKRCRNHLS